MANLTEENEFGLGELRSPLHRAEELKRRHENRAFTEKVWYFVVGLAPYAAVSSSPFLLAEVASRDPRLVRVMRAGAKSLDAAARMMGSESLHIGQGLLAGIVPMLAQLAEYAGIGAIAGGALGAVGGLGVGDELTIPGGALGGAELGLWLGGFLGLKDILVEGVKHLDRFATYAIDATELAWYAGEDRAVETEHDVHDASKLFAVAISELWWVILQALILWVMKRALEIGGKATGAALQSEAVQQALAEAKGKTAKFGATFGDWFAKNFDQIKQTVDRRQSELSASEGDDGGATPAQQSPVQTTQEKSGRPANRDTEEQPKNADDDTVERARLRQAQMLTDNRGFNVSPTSWDKYPTIGRNGTYVTDQAGITDVMGDLPIDTNQMTISKGQAANLENALGLQPGTLQDGFKVRQIDNLQSLAPRSPLEGNDLFQGPGEHLPGGAPEMVVNSIPTTDTQTVTTIMNVQH